VEGLEEHPGARRGTSESGFFPASYGGVVTARICYTLAYLDWIASCMPGIDFHSSKSSSTPSRRRRYLVRFLSAWLLCIDTSHPCIYTIRFIPVYIAISDFLENSTTSGFAEGLPKAHDAYGIRGSS
jgi:hypothetical protein